MNVEVFTSESHFCDVIEKHVIDNSAYGHRCRFLLEGNAVKQKDSERKK